MLVLGAVCFTGASARPAEADGKTVFQKRCGGCHAARIGIWRVPVWAAFTAAPAGA